jgi:hypothetical protein
MRSRVVCEECCKAGAACVHAQCCGFKASAEAPAVVTLQVSAANALINLEFTTEVLYTELYLINYTMHYLI